MASAMPSSAAAAEGEEEGEGDALDVSSSSLSLAFLREDMLFKKSSSGFVLRLKKYGDFGEGSNPLVHLRHTQNKKCLLNITLALRRKQHKTRRRRRKR